MKPLHDVTKMLRQPAVPMTPGKPLQPHSARIAHRSTARRLLRGIPRWNGSARPARRILPAARADRNRRGGEAIEAPPERSAATRAGAGAPPDADTGPAR